MKTPSTPSALPWWRVPTLWLVIAGPALVVMASITTAVVAWRGGDQPLPTVSAPKADTMTPATQARNHAATAR
jgi:hypothetical protein